MNLFCTRRCQKNWRCMVNNFAKDKLSSVQNIELALWPWWCYLISLNKVMGYWLLVGNMWSAMCPNTDVSLRVHWRGDPSVMYNWEYRQRIMVAIPMNTPSHDTWTSGSRESGWGVIHVEIVLSHQGLI